jgi:hypothetical protein
MSIQLPQSIKEVFNELEPNYWEPQTIDEWSTVVRTTAVLNAWKEQQDQERKLRKTYARWVFGLITFQIIMIFVLVFLDSISWIAIKETTIKILLPSALGEIFGMGFLVVKYLFGKQNDRMIDTLLGKLGD